ncbi:MAG: T9SS type A sorting domain-containing protein [Bacteroidota bacterium]
MFLRKFLILVLIIVPCLLFAQDFSGRKNVFHSQPAATVNVSQIKSDYHIQLTRVNSVYVGNPYYNKWFKALKDSVAKIYPSKGDVQSKTLQSYADTTLILRNFNGNPTGGGVPNDNTLAISNGNKLVSCVNTEMSMWDVNNDTVQSYSSVSLAAFCDTLHVAGSLSDPKLIYDPEFDRFVVVFFAGNTDSITTLILGFSKTNDPTQEWNLYTLPGNPFHDTTWFDYPAIALTKKEFFLTGNLLFNGGTWQTSFKQSIIWQINKEEAFNGLPLNTLLWDSIQCNHVPLRNIHPVQGSEALYGDKVYLLSNRNFAVQSDTIFLITISDIIANQPELNVHLIHADKAYGMAPDAYQGLSRLATNDARVLGAFYHNNQIQFVFNSIDTTSGRPSVYHGILSGLSGNYSIHGNIISDTVDLGYPNIAYCGNYPNDYQSIISVNHASKTVFSGFSRYFYQGNDLYSKRAITKFGTSFATSVYSRWGDYSGSQRKYNQPGIVWASGSWGYKYLQYRLNATWIAELKTPFEYVPNQIPGEYSTKVFPNPSMDEISNCEFDLPSDSHLLANLYDINGRLVKKLLDKDVKAGSFVLSFSTTPLSKGMYFISIEVDGKKMKSEKLLIDK